VFFAPPTLLIKLYIMLFLRFILCSF
jgi:hypothetical protein